MAPRIIAPIITGIDKLIEIMNLFLRYHARLVIVMKILITNILTERLYKTYPVFG
jgi:hypothetical protein